MRTFLKIAAFCCVITLSMSASAQRQVAFDITGGPAWQLRTGPGVMLTLGGNTCLREYCDEVWDTGFFGSFGASYGFFYRIIPNAVAFAELHTGYIHTEREIDPLGNPLRDDGGFLFQLTVGGEFHLPVTGWLDPYAGLGIGFAHLGLDAEYKDQKNDTIKDSFNGFNFEMRVGVDVYPISSLPTLGVGPQMRLGLVAWPDQGVCSDNDLTGLEDQCGNDSAAVGADRPFLFHLGLAAKYGF